MFDLMLQVLVLVAVTNAKVAPSYVPLYNGNMIPAISFGTVGITDLVQTAVKPAVVQAVEAGYRHINMAAVYKNEKQIGEAIVNVVKRGVVKREELFITTKLHPTVGTREGVIPAVKESLSKLNLDYIDLYLIHSPDNWFNVPDHDYLSVWKGLEDARAMNLVRYIGVSNFNSTHINRLLVNSDTVPYLNEIEVNPTFTNLELVAYCQSLNITVSAYGPLGYMVPRPFPLTQVESTFDEPILKRLAEKYGKMPNQIVLRYLLDRGIIPMPKSTNVDHIKSNIDVFDFQLTPEEIYMINELNQDRKVYNFDKESFDALVSYFKF